MRANQSRSDRVPDITGTEIAEATANGARNADDINKMVAEARAKK